jgi:hypothetical protein
MAISLKKSIYLTFNFNYQADMKQSRNRIKAVILVIFAMTISIFSAKSQVGLELMISQQRFSSWNDQIDEYGGGKYHFMRFSYGAGVNYWFGMEKFRIDFTPGLYFMYSDHRNDRNHEPVIYYRHTAGLKFDINIYPLDIRKLNFETDCPRFSGKSDFVTRNLFMQISPGIIGSYMNIDNMDLKHFDIAGKIDLGIGIDLNIAGRLYVSPILKYGFNFQNNWRGFSEYHNSIYGSDRSAGNYGMLILCFFRK